MCPENARVGCFDDNVDAILEVKERLKDHGHELVVSDTNGGWILKHIGELIEEYKIEVIILDRNFNNFTYGGDDFVDGIDILNEIRKFPDVKVIGFSSEEEFPGVDINLGRSNIDKLCQTIDKL